LSLTEWVESAEESFMGPAFSTGKKVIGVFAFGLAILAVIGWVSYRSTDRLIQLGRDRNRAHLIFEQLQDLFSQLQDAETGQRGFVITGDERYLDPYQSALGTIDQSLRALRQSTSDNPHLQQQLDTLHPLISQKLNQLKVAIEARRTQGFQAAVSLVQTGQGKKSMDSIRQVMAGVKRDQAAVVQECTLEMQSTAQRTTGVIIFGSLLSLLVVGLATIVIFRDLAHRQRVEEALRSSEQKLAGERDLLHTLMDNVPDYIYFKDARTRFTRVNRAHARALGLRRPEDAMGKTDFDFFTEEHAREAFADEQEILRTSQPLLSKVEEAPRLDGFTVWVDTTKVPIRDANGCVTGLFGISRDITRRKQAEDAIRRLNAELESRTIELSATNKELEAFSYSVSHDLRAPLRSIDGFSQALLEDYHHLLDEPGKDFLNRIRSSTQRMAQLIDDLIELSRVTRAEVRPEAVNLSAIAKAMAEELRTSEPGRRVEFSIAENLLAQGDEHLLRVAMDNLIRNAWKFTSKRPSARIEVGTAGREDNHMVYFVRDDGAGFEMDHAQKLFSPFQRLHSMAEFSGTGVGLATVQRIVHRHGGRVWAEGQVDRGACFYFTL
jgi:PAS domain S-box-containing protein